MKNFIISLVAFLAATLSITQVSAQCSASCSSSTSLNFSTGWDETTGTLISAGQVDPHWRLMNIPPLTGSLPNSVAVPSAYGINPFGNLWNVIPGSMPMSMANQFSFGSDNADITQPWRFRRYFCVCEDTEVELIGHIKADDTGSLLLYDGNGNPMPFSVALAPAPNTDNFNIGVSFGQALFLPAGNYYFEFSLLNTDAIASGFAVQGTMLSTNGLTLYDEQLGCCAVSVITGQKILEDGNNCDQIFDPATDQVGVGFVFDLINSTGNIIATAQSDAFGEFEFNNLQPGSYIVRERQEWGWLGLPLSIQVTLGALDVQTVTFFNCPYTPVTWAGCVYGDTTADPTNIHNEKGLALIHEGGFFGADNTYTFSSTNVPLGIPVDEQIVGKHWDATGVLQPNAILSDFSDVDPGAHTIENLHVVSTSAPCIGGAFAAVGTTRNGSNTDIFYAEYSTNGSMLAYVDVTSTANPNRESAHELIKLSNNDLMWVGTHILPPFPVYSNLIISTLANCSVSDQTFSFQDINGQQVSVTGRSILELDTPLPGHLDAKYAVTGSFGDKTYLLLLNALLAPTFWQAYDIDGNPNTKEEAIRIRRDGDNLFLLGNSRISGSFTTPSVEKIFMLKLGFVNQVDIPSVLTNKLYDIPGGGEKIVDAEINFNGDLILTGISALPTAAVVVSGDPEVQKTFLMGLDPFGNQLWLNQVQLQEGSEPADLKLGNLFDQIYVVGTCWTNEQVFNNGILSNRRNFDEMVLRATSFGELSFNNGCQTPLDALVTEPIFTTSSFMPSLVTPPFSVVDGPLSYHDYFLKSEYCMDEFSCDDLMITSQAITNTTAGTCCYSLDYSNSSPEPVYELCIRIGALTVSNISVDPMLTYTVNAAGNELKIRSATGTTLSSGQIQDAIEYCVTGTGNYFAVDYFWKDIDGNIICEDLEEIPCSSIDCDFTWEANCCEVQFFGSPTGTSTYTYEWDINCDNPASPDLTGQSPNWTFPGTGSYQVCLRVRDTATGASCFIEKTVNVADNPPVMTCPPSITISTDPGLCIATHQLMDPTIDDDCTEMFNFSCFMSGATSGLATSPITLNKGITTIDCSTEDEKGNLVDCTYTITVIDTENPVITCTPPPTVSVPACDGGANITFANPVVTDNCPMVTWTSSHNSGDFFPCGTTTVTFTATDMAGNQSVCTMPVVVNCECAEVGNQVIECTDVEDQFFFSVDVTDLTGAGANACTISVSSPQAGITISNLVTSGTGPNYLLSGLIDVAAPPMPNSIIIVVSVSCVCPDGTPHNCSFTINLATPCCKEIAVDPQEVCKVGGAVQIPLIGCNSLYDVQQVRWYVSDTPCPAVGSWGAPIQVTNGCVPLTLSPQYHNGDVCVYAEVVMGPDAGPCTMLTSNIATIQLCEPTGCSLNSQAFCWTGSPILPAPLTVVLSPPTPACTYTLDWFDPNGNPIPSAANLTTYQPPALNFTGAAADCSQSYTYRVDITDVCGTRSCSSTIRLDNEAAPNGLLELLPPDVNPLCYGEDAEIGYTPECAGDPERWDWFRRPDAVPTYTPLISNGDRNPLYFTNRLYEDTWIKVEKTNGVCPTDEIELFLDIIDPLAIQNFTAQLGPVCAPTMVNMEVDFSPSPATAGCSYTISWYRNGAIIATSTHTNSPATYDYTPPAGVSLDANYYCVISSDCCLQQVKSTVITLEPPMEVYAVGPCFRCNCDTIMLQGIVEYPIPGMSCTYQWLDNGVAILGETGLNLVVDPSWQGLFTFEVTCTDGTTICDLSDTYDLLQCNDCIIDNVQELPVLNSQLYPNPTTGRISIEFDKLVNFDRVEVFDLQGRLVHLLPERRNGQRFEVDLSHLPNGAYIIQAISAKNELLIQRVIKQ